MRHDWDLSPCLFPQKEAKILIKYIVYRKVAFAIFQLLHLIVTAVTLPRPIFESLCYTTCGAGCILETMSKYMSCSEQKTQKERQLPSSPRKQISSCCPPAHEVFSLPTYQRSNPDDGCKIPSPPFLTYLA